MHTIHYIAVEAANAEEAFEMVEAEFSVDSGSPADWSDWCVIGGGRWSENPNNQYNNSSEDVISYAEQPEKFLETLAKVRKWRINEANSLLQKVNPDKIKTDLVEYASNNGQLPDDIRWGDMNSYYLKLAVNLTRDYYYPDSHFFDLHEYNGASMSGLQARLDNPEQAPLQYLVPVDFHY